MCMWVMRRMGAWQASGCFLIYALCGWCGCIPPPLLVCVCCLRVPGAFWSGSCRASPLITVFLVWPEARLMRVASLCVVVALAVLNIYLLRRTCRLYLLLPPPCPPQSFTKPKICSVFDIRAQHLRCSFAFRCDCIVKLLVCHSSGFFDVLLCVSCI